MFHLHQLPRQSARLCLSVERFCLEELRIPQGSTLLLAVSGGADSTALACIFAILKARLGLHLFALTIDHSLRQEAEADAAYAQKVCDELCIPCQKMKVDIAKLASIRGQGIEEAGRHARYSLLERYRRKIKADFIALGHHAEDLSEDILLRLLRGTGWPALGGMAARDDVRHILRPFLHTKPISLKKIVHDMGFTWCEDQSNTDPAFTRNRLRHTILPLLRKENPAFEIATGRLWRLAQWDTDYWNDILATALTEHPPEESQTDGIRKLTFSRSLLAGLHPAVRTRLFYMAARRFYMQGKRHHQGQVRAETVFKLEEALQSGRGNTCFQFPGGLTAKLQRGSVCFYTQL